MTRNTHDRTRDHHGTDTADNMGLATPSSSYAEGTSVEVILAALDDRVIELEQATASSSSTAGIVSANCVIGDGSGVVPTGVVYPLVIDFHAQITKWTLVADQSGSIVIDIWKDTYANYPPTGADTITASAKPTLSSVIKNSDTTLTGWTTAIRAGDILLFNVDSATTVTKVTLALRLQKVADQIVSPPLIYNTVVIAPEIQNQVVVPLVGPSTTIFAPTVT